MGFFGIIWEVAPAYCLNEARAVETIRRNRAFSCAWCAIEQRAYSVANEHASGGHAHPIPNGRAARRVHRARNIFRPPPASVLKTQKRIFREATFRLSRAARLALETIDAD